MKVYPPIASQIAPSSTLAPETRHAWESRLLSAALNAQEGEAEALIRRVPADAFMGETERRAWSALSKDATNPNLFGVLTSAGIEASTFLAWADLDRGGAYAQAAEAAIVRAYKSAHLRAVAADYTAGRIGADRLAAEVDAASRDEGQMIVLPGGDVPITKSAAKIFGLIGKQRGMFFRGGRVHEIANNSDGSTRLEPISPSQFQSRLEQYGRVFAWRTGVRNEKMLKPTTCPQETAKALLESRPAGEFLPNVATLVSCPVLAKVDGEILLLGAGWHPVGGGLFVTGGEAPPTVPLNQAVDALIGILGDFDFASSGDRSRALASLIAPALRFGGWLDRPLPVDIGEADSSQSGKTYRQKVVAAIYRESCNLVVQRSGGVGGLDESLSQKLIDGRPFILFDNLRGKLDSAFLEAILTAPGTMPARVPHRGEVQVDARGFVFQITSNGVETTRDLANRASIVRIRKRETGLAFRTYAEGDLHAHIVANQPFYLGCVFAVVADWASKGQPRTKETRHSFREWAQSLDWIVQNIFSATPLLDGHVEATQRVSDPRRIWLRSLCIALRDAGRTGELCASQVAEFASENEITPPNIRAHADEASIARAVGKVMAGAFANADEIEIDGFRIKRSMRYSTTAAKEIPAYTFTT